MGSSDAFDLAIADFALAYAERNESDHAAWVAVTGAKTTPDEKKTAPAKKKTPETGKGATAPAKKTRKRAAKGNSDTGDKNPAA